MYSEKYEPEIFTEAVYNKMLKIHQMHIHKVSYVYKHFLGHSYNKPTVSITMVFVVIIIKHIIFSDHVLRKLINNQGR